MTANMEIKAIDNHTELLARLAALKLEKGIQEMTLRYTVTEYIESFDFFSLFKSNTSKSFTNDLTMVGLNMATNFIAGLVLGKNNSIKGYLSALMVKKFTSKILNSDVIDFVASIGSMVFRNKK